jgi:uncharacterized protein YdgA (DUF945 family)
LKKTIIAAAIVSVLLAQSNVQAIEQAPSPQPHPQAAATPVPPSLIKSATIETLAAAAKEMHAATGGQQDAGKKLDLYARFEFSPELRPKLKAIFGTERPFPMQRTVGAKGQINYAAKLMPHTYLEDGGTVFTWAELSAKVSTNKAGNMMNFSSTWPSLSIAGMQSGMTLQNMRFDFKQSRATDGVWYGTAVATIGTMSVRATAPGTHEARDLFRIDDIQARSEVLRRGKKAEVVYGWSSKTITAGGEKIDRTNIGVRLVNLPAQAMADLDSELRNEQASGLAPAAQRQVMMRTLTHFGKDLVIGGAAVVIDDISASYRGNTASIKGRIDFDKVVDADFSAPLEFGKKIVARLELRLPVALVNDVSRLVASKQMNASAPDAAGQLDTAAKNMAAVVVGKLVNEGFAVMDKGELRSTIDVKNGKITFNGKTVPLPGMPDGDLALAFKNMPKPVPAPVAVPVQ